MTKMACDKHQPAQLTELLLLLLRKNMFKVT